MILDASSMCRCPVASSKFRGYSWPNFEGWEDRGRYTVKHSVVDYVVAVLKWMCLLDDGTSVLQLSAGVDEIQVS